MAKQDGVYGRSYKFCCFIYGHGLLGGYDCSKATTGGYEWDLKDGRKIELRITIKDEKSDENDKSK